MTPDSTRDYCRRHLDPSSTNDVSPFRQDLLHLHIFSPSAALLGRGVFRYIGEGDDRVFICRPLSRSTLTALYVPWPFIPGSIHRLVDGTLNRIAKAANA